MQQNYSIDIAALLETWYAVKARLSVQELDAVEGMRGAIFSWVSFKGVQEPLIECPHLLADVISHLEKIHHAMFDVTIPVLKIGAVESSEVA